MHSLPTQAFSTLFLFSFSQQMQGPAWTRPGPTGHLSSTLGSAQPALPGLLLIALNTALIVSIGNNFVWTKLTCVIEPGAHLYRELARPIFHPCLA